MEKYYEYDGELKKKMLKRWLNSQKKWKTRKIVAGMLFLLAGVIFATCIIGMAVTTQNIEFVAMAAGGGFIFGIIPFAIGQSVYITGRKKYGEPYGFRVQEFLFVNDSGFQFGYHDIENEFSESMNVYQIPYENITRIIFDNQSNILTVIGIAELIAYDDIQAGRINHYKSQRKFYKNSDYSFILSFKEQQEFLDAVNSRIPRLEN